MKQVKYIILFTIISFVYLSENIFAYPVYLLPPDDANAAKVIDIIPECNGVSAGDEINLTAKTEPAETKVFWQIPGKYSLHFSIKSTSDNTAKFHAGEYGGYETMVLVRASPFASDSDINCATTNIKVFECKKCSGGSITNKVDGTLSTDPPPPQCCVNGERIQKNPIPDYKELEDCPDRQDNPNAGKKCDGCSVPELVQKLLIKDPNNPMEDPSGCARFDINGCCNHDKCYGTCKKNRLECEENFRQDLASICNRCYDKNNEKDKYFDCMYFAAEYSLATLVGGGDAWEKRQRRGCNCCTDEPAR